MATVQSNAHHMPTFPCIWKRAIVNPPHKKIGLENIHKNYRPVSTLNFISKLLESAVLQIQEHLYNLNLLPQYQSSYWVNFLIETLLQKLMQQIQTVFAPGTLGSQPDTYLVPVNYVVGLGV